MILRDLQAVRAGELAEVRRGLLGVLGARVVAEGRWAIVRCGYPGRWPETRREFKSEKAARAAWGRMDVRQGWAELRRPDGAVEARQSGPAAVRTRW